MYIKHLIFIFSTILCVSSELREVEEMYLNFFVQMESVKKSVDILKVHLDALNGQNPNRNCALIDNKFLQVFENFGVVKKSLDDLKIRIDTISDKSNIKPREENIETNKLILDQKHETFELNIKYSKLLSELNAVKESEKSLKDNYFALEDKYIELSHEFDKSKKTNEDLQQQINSITKSILDNEKAKENYWNKQLFDERVDKLPEFKKYCYQDPAPVDCKSATKCTQKSGYYKIFIPGNKTKQIMVYCDEETNQGGWMHILRRQDGSENFTRLWSDYVNGFGKVDGEYWIGLDNLHALTNYNGRQQLYVYMENFEGESNFALYDNFVVGNATELYELKSAGKHYGMGEDDLEYNVGSKFSTIDNDNDDWPNDSCAVERQSGWWYTFCTYVQPTGQYLPNITSRNGVVWSSFGGKSYTQKVMHLMIKN